MLCVFYIPDISDTELKKCKICGKEKRSKFAPEQLRAFCMNELPPIHERIFNLLTSAQEFVSDGMSLVDKEIYKERLEICNMCDERIENACKICGCNLALKAAGKVFRCPFRSTEYPEGKWPR